MYSADGIVLAKELIRDNPWWRRAEEIRQDADLVRLREKAVRFEHPVPFDLDADAVYTLRGPRQVGKSTLLKRIAQQLLLERGVAARNVMYFDVEGAGISTTVALQEVVSGYLDWVRTSDAEGRVYLLLDEVTGVTDWGSFVRVLFRRGALDQVTILVTGSHALDIKRGGEMAPGRRGEGAELPLDWIMMPLSFRDYLAAHAPETEAALPSLDLFEPALAHAAAQELEFHAEVIRPLFERYLLTGGYPHATATEQATGRIPPTVYQLYRQAIVGQMRRAGHRESHFREIVSWAADGRLGREFSWRDVSAETDIGSKDTARVYVEDAEAMFLWHVFYRSQSPDEAAPALRSPKKLYPADPFSWHVLASWAAGDADPWADVMERVATPIIRGELVESVVADHLRRRFGSFALYYRATRGDEEIDFVVHAGNRKARVEVKYQARIVSRNWEALAKYGGGVLATLDRLEWQAAANVACIPLSTLLAGFAEPASLFPARD
jgi:uncharacterized protein